MIKSLYIGNVEFILEADGVIEFDDCLMTYSKQLLPIDRRVIYHIRYGGA